MTDLFSFFLLLLLCSSYFQSALTKNRLVSIDISVFIRNLLFLFRFDFFKTALKLELENETKLNLTK